MTQLGATSISLEGTITQAAEIFINRSEVPVISRGSGPDCDGQIHIENDILGLIQGSWPKFSKSFAKLADDTIDAFNSYNKEIKTGQFPDDQHSYHS